MERFERAMGMKPTEWNDSMVKRSPMCRCHECATYIRAIEESQEHYKSLGWDVSTESSAESLGRQFCHSGRSPRISKEIACLCKNCQVAREMFITLVHYCLHSDAPARMGALDDLDGLLDNF
ncbi:MAG: DUF2769 domain-containing protein [Candidatus Thorarchaeota archaeon]|jgi:hypothetical protein